MFILPALMYLKVLSLFGQCLYRFIVTNKSRPPHAGGGLSPGRIFANPALIELRQEIGQYDWLASPRDDDVVLCSRMEIITKQAIECGLGISLGFCCLDYKP
ncbi:hypothetical protein AVEN_12121-1 [Araneus ventricosus]|uniref:Uncharacterized protein n=1 Tax=Araneus ventricosus TaxID=182803 RepID=A0A4Y2M0C0_ARAVE|nr:hypothetical protein AVEN_12121-1 [Araneus ventricosus]